MGRPSTIGMHSAPARMNVSSVLVPARKKGSRPPLFLTHGLAGTILLKPDLVRNLHPEQPLYFLQARGVDGKDPPLDSVEAMARDYLEAVRTVQPAGPYYLGGFCDGSLIGIEMAHQLAAVGEQVGSLLVVDPSPIPHAIEGEFKTRWSLKRWRKRLARVTVQPVQRLRAGKSLIRKSDPFTPGGFHALYEQIGAAVESGFMAAEDGKTRANAPIIEAAVKASNATARAIRRYRPKPYHGPMHLICNEAREAGIRSPNLYWANACPQARVHVVGKAHMSMLMDELDKVGRCIQRCLDEDFGPLPALAAQSPDAVAMSV
jgi:thioesterase domain-containing protein